MPERGLSPLFGYFASRVEEREFEVAFSGNEVEIEGASVEFSEGTGYTMRQIQGWRPL